MLFRETGIDLGHTELKYKSSAVRYRCESSSPLKINTSRNTTKTHRIVVILYEEQNLGRVNLTSFPDLDATLLERLRKVKADYFRMLFAKRARTWDVQLCCSGCSARTLRAGIDVSRPVFSLRLWCNVGGFVSPPWPFWTSDAAVNQRVSRDARARPQKQYVPSPGPRHGVGHPAVPDASRAAVFRQAFNLDYILRRAHLVRRVDRERTRLARSRVRFTGHSGGEHTSDKIRKRKAQ